MKLFDVEIDKNRNLLPRDGVVNYFGKVFSEEDAIGYFETFRNSIQWKNDEVMIFGKKIVTKRQVAWYGDREFEYTYSKLTRKAHLWTPELRELKQKIEAISGETFNSCLLNLYHTGEEGMGWHSDAEKDLKKNAAIASVSIGAARKFMFKHKETKETFSLTLEHGSLLIMKGTTQLHWLHRLPPTKKVQAPRINLTFRTIET
ncbi:alpha-ketoglutarate-dependent dioxygenase AlkB family protein [Aequorivita marina]|uniref:alpha-ketoglutarate-dependent dioxygenase AlkB family protein n=1 Tax=Aequorivita marina TaxID=3073654 RepID=UPI002875BB7D|nr:alpha-ketoglutarate-dependent dioxygenase AlkB [Aequorivita sp. S2608]MDS1299247.1 alpha-ketoglutarate-dependent dioxygenase AlkB [Aequorivita sp. S2608]